MSLMLHGAGFYHQSHPQLGIIFALAPSLHSFWCVKSLQSCLPLFDPILAHQAPLSMEILQARILEWVLLDFDSKQSVTSRSNFLF